VLLFDDRLRVQEAALPGDVASVVSAAPAGDDGAVWVVDGHGRLLRVNPDGKVTAEIPTPYVVPAIGGAGDDGVIALVRSVEGFPFALDTAPEPPVVLVDATGRQVRRLGTSVVPAHVLLSDLANAGHVVRIGDQTVFAPFVRDEIIAFGPQGDTLWIVRRGLRHETPEPRFVVRGGRPVLDYFPVNLGLGVGPDGRLYVLSTTDTTLGHARLDVLDPSSGEMLATLPLPTAFPTIVVTRGGEVHLVSSGTLLARSSGAARPQMPAFDWPALGGERVTDAALRGRVTIVNAWASWCAPCREEMPALADLWHALADSGLALLAVNEDVQAEDARQWLRDTDLDLPVVLAGGRGRGVLHYPGLPYTMLVDREGRIVRKWVGYLGPEQIEAIGAAARRELAGGSAHRHEAQSGARGHEHAVPEPRARPAGQGDAHAEHSAR
jgi:thiol-disulfide isomerase/thioredoxin